MKNTQLKRELFLMFMKKNLIFFIGMFYLVCYSINILQTDTVKVNSVSYSGKVYFFYVVLLPAIGCLFLGLIAFLFTDKKLLRKYIQYFNAISIGLLAFSPLIILYVAFSPMHKDIVITNLISLLFVFCTTYYVNIIALINCTYFILEKFSFHLVELPKISYKKINIINLILSGLCIKLISIQLLHWSILLLCIMICNSFNLLFIKNEKLTSSGILLFAVLLIIFFPAILFFFFNNQCLLKFILA